eukprot:6762623-Alexandrium_andersonii.AAC.1
MSASLVGSEMCIRDRTRTVSRSSSPWPSRPLRLVQCRQTGPTGRSPTTVSYTHLTLPTICSV